jgi:hypothetical protein
MVSKIQSESINLADNFAFTGTVTGAAANTAEFLAYMTSDQTGIGDASWTKVTFNAESYDPDGVFDNSSNYRFVAPSAGKYILYTNIVAYDASTDIEDFTLALYKNGSNAVECAWNKNSGNRLRKANQTISIVLDLASSDYIEVYVNINTVDGGTTNIESQSGIIQNYFGGYKILT